MLRPGELLGFLAVLSGYDDDLSKLVGVDPCCTRSVIDYLAELACQKSVHLFCGSLVRPGHLV